MYLLRCTNRLGRDVARFHQPALRRDRSDTRLGDWFANRLNVGPRRYVLATSARSLLSVVVPARDPARLPERVASALDALLRHLGVAADVRSAEIAAMAAVKVAPTNSRPVLGSMTHIAGLAYAELYDMPHRPGRTLHHVNAWLAAEPNARLELATPADAALRLLLPG
jgi:hypothetical protein